MRYELGVDVPGKSGVRELHCAATNRGPSSHALPLVHQRKPDFTATISRVFPANGSYTASCGAENVARRE